MTWIREQIEASPESQIGVLDAGGNARFQTYAGLWERAGQVTARLRDAGIGHAAPVLLALADPLDLVPAFWACLRAGLLAVPFGSLSQERSKERRGARFHATARLLEGPVVLGDDLFLTSSGDFDLGPVSRFIHIADCHGAPSLAADTPPAITCLLPTSGSTGATKLVALHDAALFYRFCSNRFGIASRPSRILSLFAADSVSGLGLAFPGRGMRLQLPISEFLERPAVIFDAIEEHGIKLLQASNSFLAIALDADARNPRPRNLSSLRSVGVGAETVVPAIMRRLDRVLSENGAPSRIIRAGYGSTETGPLVMGADPTEAKDDESAPLGPSAPGVVLRIVGEQGEQLAEGELGEVQTQCPEALFSGYWGDEKAFRAGFTPDGWWRTGDRGYLRDGVLRLHGRLKETIVVHGRKHSLADIDSHLESVLAPGVRTFSCAVHWPGAATERLAVAFVIAADAGSTSIAAAIREHVSRRFLLQPKPVFACRLDEIPLTSTGKLRRFELAELVRSGQFRTAAEPKSTPTTPVAVQAGSLQADLACAWSECLELHGSLDPKANFFDLGGDSLRAEQLFSRVEQRLGRSISADAFFAAPTLGTLLLLGATAAQKGPPAPPVDASELAWPLPPALRLRQMRYFESWDGERPTRDRLVAGLNTSGSRPPLFWVFQDAREFSRLARHLGPDQPLYALRSGHLVMSYTEDSVQVLALRYTHEIMETRPNGQLFVGGNCQGAIIALATAQHLMRRKRLVPLLALMEWSFALQPYSGPVLMVYGRDSAVGNPYLRYRDPDRGWRRVFRDYADAEIPGSHGEFFEDANIEVLAQVLGQNLSRAARLPATLTPDRMLVRLTVTDVPSEMWSGDRHVVTVDVVNSSLTAWSSATSGTLLGNYWVDDQTALVERLDGRTEVPELSPNEATRLYLTITAPQVAGRLYVVIGLVEEGSAWLGVDGTDLIRHAVTIKTLAQNADPG